MKWNISRYLRRLETYLVCPMRCTRPTACNSWAGFKAGSTNNTCVASMMFRPLEPVCRGRRSTPTRESCLNVCRFDCGEKNYHITIKPSIQGISNWGGWEGEDRESTSVFVWPDTHFCSKDTRRRFDICLCLTGLYLRSFHWNRTVFKNMMIFLYGEVQP